MEQGRIFYKQERLEQASLKFNKASQLLDKYYTVKIKEKLISSITNDNSQTYQGSVFERSMLYYYQALSQFKLYQIGKTKKTT